MNKKVRLFGIFLLVVSLTLTVAFAGKSDVSKSNLSTATAGDFYAAIDDFNYESIFGKNESTTASSSDTSTSTTNLAGDISNRVSERVSGFIDEKGLGEIGENIGGIGDTLTGFLNSDSLSGFGEGIGDAVGGFDIGNLASGVDLGNIGGSLSGGSGLGSLFGGLFSGGLFGGNTETTAAPVTYSNTYIEPVATKAPTQDPTKNDTPAAVQTTHGETVDYALQSIPYAKPSGEYKEGDKGDAVRWMQWVFIYTHYGLRDDGITGVLDDDTVAVVKKLQQERGFAVDGVVNDKVIDAVETLYYQYKNSVTATAAPVQTTGETVPVDNGGNKANSGAVTAMLIALAVIWAIAIALIVIIFVNKKKKKKKAQNREMTALEKAVESGSGEFSSEAKAEPVQNEDVSSAPNGEKAPEIKSLADLFEEADNNTNS